MLGMETLTIGFLLTVLFGYYILDYFGIVAKILPMLAGYIPKSKLFLVVAIAGLMVTTGFVSFSAVSDGIGSTVSGVTTPPATTAQEYSYDLVFIGMEEDGTAFTDTTYTVHLIGTDQTLNGRSVGDIYKNPTAPFKAGEGDLALLYALMQEEYDNGINSVPGAYPSTTAGEFAETISSGEWKWDSVTAKVGDEFYIYGRYDTSLAKNEYEPFIAKTQITGVNPDQGEFSLSLNRKRVYKISTDTIYNFAETSVAGYTEDEDAAAADKLIDVDYFADANNNVSTDMHLYLELTSDMQSRVDQITVSNDDGEFATYNKFTDTTNLNTDDWRFESAPSLTVSTSTMYYVGGLPDSLRTATTNKDKVNLEMQYDHSGATDTNKNYLKLVHFARFGNDFHIDGDNFWLNATTGGTDGWT